MLHCRRLAIFLVQELTWKIFALHSTVPTVKDITVPETLLKKQKAAAKTEAELKAQEAEKKKASFDAKNFWSSLSPSLRRDSMMILGVKPID